MPEDSRTQQEKEAARAFWAYNTALAAGTPLLAGWFAWRVLGSGKSRDGWLQRLGLADRSFPAVSARESVWFHAVSVGEVAAIAPVVRSYLKTEDPLKPLLSTITQTGRKMAERVLPEAGHFYLPVDVLPAVRASVGRIQPRCLVLCEAEIWPNLLNEVKRTGASVALVNGRVSDKTAERKTKFGWIFRWALGNIDRFLMQSQEDAERVVALGAHPDKVEVAGNTKFDEVDLPLSSQQQNELRASLGVSQDTLLFVAGSINPGEDEPVLDAFLQARQQVPSLRMILAPRQIERGREIADMVKARGLYPALRSVDRLLGKGDVLILDTLGELAEVYAVSCAAFVGGTFIDKGGHNILQPLAQGVPVAYGPYSYKIRDISSRASAAQLATLTRDSGELAMWLCRMLEAPGALRFQALEFVKNNQGASRRAAEVIQEECLKGAAAAGTRTAL